MKKPLLLLVDDDRLVLEALESELAPAFGDVARIETFDDPQEVLAALPRWRAEQRAIAVAIVDQKMPGLSGVALLTALRQAVRDTDAEARPEGTPPPFHPARDLRAMLLTGYAGLDSAIAGVNEASVDRYVEKPWNARTLVAMLRRLFARRAAEAGWTRWLEFREVTEVDELREHLKLRFEAYSVSPDLVYLLPQTKSRMDMDEYDTVSRFYGLFAETESGSQQVGTVRVIGDGDSPAGRALVTLANTDPVLRERASRPLAYPIELPKKWPEPAAILRLLDAIAARDERVVEIGRLVVRESHRGGTLGGSLAAGAIMDGVAASVGFVARIENTLQNCSAKHQRAYERMGFRLAEGTVPTFVKSSAETLVVLHARPAWLPDHARRRVTELSMAQRERHATCRCPSFPACLGGAYERDEFAQVDVFCPRRSSQVGAAPGPRQAIPTETMGDAS